MATDFYPVESNNRADPSSSSHEKPDLEIGKVMERVHALERSLQQLQADRKERGSQWKTKHVQNGEKHVEVSSPRSPGCAYSTLQRKPVPSIFQMPLHYPRYKKADYEHMPEWKLDRLLEEYGLPVIGSIREKKDSAIRTFLWKDERD
eukprot:c13882_g1_i1 orf=341-784(+)